MPHAAPVGLAPAFHVAACVQQAGAPCRATPHSPTHPHICTHPPMRGQPKPALACVRGLVLRPRRACFKAIHALLGRSRPQVPHHRLHRRPHGAPGALLLPPLLLLSRSCSTGQATWDVALLHSGGAQLTPAHRNPNNQTSSPWRPPAPMVPVSPPSTVTPPKQRHACMLACNTRVHTCTHACLHATHAHSMHARFAAHLAGAAAWPPAWLRSPPCACTPAPAGRPAAAHPAAPRWWGWARWAARARTAPPARSPAPRAAQPAGGRSKCGISQKC